MIKYPFVNLHILKTTRNLLSGILDFRESRPSWDNAIFSADPLTTVSATKSKNGNDAQIHQLNYENFIRTMAKMARKYSDKI